MGYFKKLPVGSDARNHQRSQISAVLSVVLSARREHEHITAYALNWNSQNSHTGKDLFVPFGMRALKIGLLVVEG